MRLIRKKKIYTLGYGFVQFSQSEDFLKALKEMQGKYIGNRPIKLKKSEWEKREMASPPNAPIKKK